MPGLGRLVRALALALLALCASAPVHASVIPAENCIARIGQDADVFAFIARPAAFDCQIRQTALGEGDFVVRLRFPRIAADVSDPLVLRTTSVWQRSSRVVFRYADGSHATFGFDSRDVSRVLTVGAIFEFAVPTRGAPLDSIFIEARGSGNLRGVVLGAELMKRSESYELRNRLSMFYAAFAGLALALIVYNLSLWAAMRHRFQLYYCGMVAGLSAYTFSASGLLAFALPAFDNNTRLGISYFLLALTAALALQFVRNFFDSKVVGPRLCRAITIASIAGIAAALAYAVLAPWQLWLLDQLYFGAMLAMLCLFPPMLYQAWLARSPYFPLVIAAWSGPIIASFLRALHGFNVIEHSFWLDNSLLIALSLEALLSSILVTARLRELSYERDQARAGEQMARRLAATDPLTGLLNRRAFLELAIGRRQRQRLLLIDIDHFKAVNDRLGHASGDDVLRSVAEAIQACRPARSLAVRLGGEEFALLVPRSAFSECTADMVLEAVRQCPLPQGITVTASLGYADGSVGTEEDWKRLYRLADAALYRAKSDGRDRACRATDFRAVA